MIEAAGVSLRYSDDTLALQNFNLHIQPGELVYITGPSGSGKTSLLKLIMGMEYPTTGTLKVMGQQIVEGQTLLIRRLRRSIGPVFQDFRLLKGRTLIDNVILGMRFLEFSKGRLKDNAINALKKVGLEQKAFALVEHLSTGEQQRAAIARAVARKPALIVADEPTGNLDRENALHILELLASFQDSRTAVIVSTHASHLLGGGKKTSFISLDKGSMSWERQAKLK